MAGLPLAPQRLTRSLSSIFEQEAAGAGAGGEEEQDEEEENGDVYPGADRGTTTTRRRRTSAGGSEKMWGKFLALSVDIPQGLCPGRDGCSRVWMYGSESWGALRERCRVGLGADATAAGDREGARGTAGRPWQGGELSPLGAACAVGDVAGREGSEWGLEARRVCGAGPRDGGGGGPFADGGKWERARVWEVYPLEQEGG